VLSLFLMLLLSRLMVSSFAPTTSNSARLVKSTNVLRGGSDTGITPALSSSGMSTPIVHSPLSEKVQTESVKTDPLQVSPAIVDEQLKSTKNGFGPNTSLSAFFRRKFIGFPWYLVPNWLTYIRCLSIPVLIGSFYLPDSNVATSGLFAMASATDYLDGYLARKWDASSSFGAFLDPVVRANCCLYLFLCF
jgi:hypothetical protein